MLQHLRISQYPRAPCLPELCHPPPPWQGGKVKEFPLCPTQPLQLCHFPAVPVLQTSLIRNLHLAELCHALDTIFGVSPFPQHPWLRDLFPGSLQATLSDSSRLLFMYPSIFLLPPLPLPCQEEKPNSFFRCPCQKSTDVNRKRFRNCRKSRSPNLKRSKMLPSLKGAASCD